MKRNWKSIGVALLSAAATAAAAAMNRRDEPTTTARVAQTDTPAATPPPASGLRATAIAFLSDVLAETYRKIRVDTPRGKR